MSDPLAVTAEEVWQFREAEGCSLFEAKRYLRRKKRFALLDALERDDRVPADLLRLIRSMLEHGRD